MESSSATTPTPEEQKARKAAELRGAPFLVYRDDKGAQHIVELVESGKALTVGRRFEADIALPWDREVSRLHAQFEFRAGEWTVDDDGWSQNGTFVNEMRLDGQRRLHDGDLVRCGQTTIQFVHVNGQPGFLVRAHDGRLVVLSFAFGNGRIEGVFAVLNPDKLRRVPPLV